MDTVLEKGFSAVLTNTVTTGRARKHFYFMETEGLLLFSHSALEKEINFSMFLKEIGEMENS